MDILAVIKDSIDRVGVKEVARRAGLPASTVSRVNSGIINPSLEVIQKISNATGFNLELIAQSKNRTAPRLAFTKDLLGLLRNELKSLGVKHATVFGSVARGEDTATSDIDIYLEFSTKPPASKLLKAEGRILETFGETTVDILTLPDKVKHQRILKQIEKDGVRVF